MTESVASARPAIGIVILHWNNYPATRRCLDSLTAAQPAGATVYLADNGSSDGSMDRLEDEPAAIPIVFLRNGENLGFAAGANRGIQRALDDGNRYILLLNNDCIVSTPGAIESETSDSAGSCAPAYLNVTWLSSSAPREMPAVRPALRSITATGKRAR